MEKRLLIKIAEEYIRFSEGNYITENNAISHEAIGMKIFEDPILAFGSAEDDYFEMFKKPWIIGEHFITPKSWLPQAKTVISFFLPFSESVREGNKQDMTWPSDEWLHGRIEGQTLLNKLALFLKKELENAGYHSLVPSLDERYREAKYSSNWSERHVAFVCGHGTFSLSKGLITQRGMAGRFGSLITELHLSPDERTYENVYEYCVMCGKCVQNCPVKAISLENGKNHAICAKFLDITAQKFKPRYGCGKCQIGVPCESGIPFNRKRTGI